MLDAYIISEIKKRNEQETPDRPQLELPLPPLEIYHTEEENKPEPKRVIIIDMTIDEEVDEFTIDL